MPKIVEQWLQKVLDTMGHRTTVTRSQIMSATKLNSASVSHTLQFLLERGIILKVGELQSKAGRHQDVMTLNPEAGYFVAVVLESTRMRFALTNFVGDIRYRWEADVQLGQTLQIREIVAGIEMVLRNLSEVQRLRLAAIGISCPGILSQSGGVTALNLGWKNISLTPELEEIFSLPVYLEHPTHSAIRAERWVGLAQGVRDFIDVMVGHVVGVGVFSNGRFVGGRDQMAGEVGHIRIDPDGSDVCRCGKTGCLEAIVSSPNIFRQYRAKTGLEGSYSGGLRVTDVFERARRHETAAVEVPDRVTRYLRLALSYLVNFLNPELIILGGDLITAEDLLLPSLREQIAANTLPDFVKNLNIAVSRMGLDIGLKGAASLAFRTALNHPEVLKNMCRLVVELHSHSPAVEGSSSVAS
jgi:predicted NBD/HSP70 family sugar kinase